MGKRIVTTLPQHRRVRNVARLSLTQRAGPARITRRTSSRSIS
jgi:hypothetical protein